jgi:hypothetical protein
MRLRTKDLLLHYIVRLSQRIDLTVTNLNAQVLQLGLEQGPCGSPSISFLLARLSKSTRLMAFSPLCSRV